LQPHDIARSPRRFRRNGAGWREAASSARRALKQTLLGAESIGPAMRAVGAQDGTYFVNLIRLSRSLPTQGSPRSSSQWGRRCGRTSRRLGRRTDGRRAGRNFNTLPGVSDALAFADLPGVKVPHGGGVLANAREGEWSALLCPMGGREGEGGKSLLASPFRPQAVIKGRAWSLLLL